MVVQFAKHGCRLGAEESPSFSPDLANQITNAKGNPSLDTMVAIADALDVPLVALLQPPPVGTDGWDASLADSVLKDDCKLGLPPGYRRVSAIVNEHQAFQIAKWHKAAHDREDDKISAGEDRVFR